MSGYTAQAGAGVVRHRSAALDAFERGVELGSRFPEEIRSTIRSYRGLLARCPNPDVDLAAGGARALDAIERFAPAAAQEIRGIADGAGLAVHEVAGINARTELLAIADPDGVAECSTIVSAPASAPARGAQTWDWYTEMADGWLLWEIPLPGGRQIATVTEYGVLGKIGVNDAGLGLLFSILGHDSDGSAALGVPVHVLARTVLERAGTVDEALAVVADARLTASTTFTLVDRAGAAAVELFPDGRGVVRPEGGWLVRSNHFLSAEGAPGCRSTGEHSATRRRALEAWTAEAPEPNDRNLIAALTGHDPVGPLCVHDHDSLSTLATVVIDAAEPRIRVWRGGPCSTSA